MPESSATNAASYTTARDMIIDAAPECPPSSRYRSHFGSLLDAYRLIDCQPPNNCQFINTNKRLEATRYRVMADLLVAIKKVGGQVSYDPGTDLIRINDEFTEWSPSHVAAFRTMPIPAGLHGLGERLRRTSLFSSECIRAIRSFVTT